MLPKNRMNRYRETDEVISEQTDDQSPEFPIFQTQADLYAEAWRLARRDVELDRLFNSWYYEI